MSELEEVLSKWEKETGSAIIRVGGEVEECKRICFSSPLANYMSYGGIPRGKATEIFGGDGGGKTTTALDLCANAQRIFKDENEWDIEDITKELDAAVESKKAKRTITALQDKLKELKKGPKKVVYLDLENTLDLEWAVKLGVDLEEMIIITPENDSAERILQKVIDMISTGEVGLLVMDSIPCLVPQQIYDESMEKKSYGGVSAPISVFCSKIVPHLHKTGCALICINQVREDLNNPYNDVVTPGGKALKHLYSVRLRARKGSLLNEDNKEIPNRSPRPCGNVVQLEVVKSKAFKPDRRLGSYTLNYTTGIDVINDLVQISIIAGTVMASGAWYSLVDPQTGEIMTDEEGNDLKFQGVKNLVTFLKNNPDICEELDDYAQENLKTL